MSCWLDFISRFLSLLGYQFCCFAAPLALGLLKIQPSQEEGRGAGLGAGENHSSCQAVSDNRYLPQLTSY